MQTSALTLDSLAGDRIHIVLEIGEIRFNVEDHVCKKISIAMSTAPGETPDNTAARKCRIQPMVMFRNGLIFQLFIEAAGRERMGGLRKPISNK